MLPAEVEVTHFYGTYVHGHGRTGCYNQLMNVSRFSEGQEVMLPLDIAIQSILSLLLAMFGVLHIAGEFKVFLFVNIIL
jgi:hypothetical protein